MVKVDLNKLKEEFATEKQKRTVVAEQKQGASLMPRDKFLTQLYSSFKTGQENSATDLIKLVENKTAIKHGEIATHNVQTMEVSTQSLRPTTAQPLNEDSPERDELLFEDLEKKRRRTLADSMKEYINTPQIGTPMTNAVPQQYGNGMQQPMQLNEQYLAENVKKIVNNYLVENFGPVVEEAIRSTVIEMYAVERIKEVLIENKEMIKTIVSETLKEIIAKNKAAKGQ